MSRIVKGTWLAAIFGFGLCMASTAPATADDRSAKEIIRDIDNVKFPLLDRSKIRDQAYIREFMAKNQEAGAKVDGLVMELYKAAPDHERITRLMSDRWARMGMRFDDLYKDVDAILAHDKNPKLRIEGTFAKARARLMETTGRGSPDLTYLDEFVKIAPKDPRGAGLLYSATFSTQDAKVKAALEDRLLKDFPDSPATSMIKATRHQREMVGKPFDLEFTDAIKGSTVSIKGLKGKVVVIDFWATWCGPCVNEMPHMKGLYAKYRDQGVEFIGVSLDQPKEQGGLDALKKFVKENQIPWPQYYQGNYWQSEFSKSWGINSIPALFVVDTEGKLYSLEARGHLETIIPELLKKKSAPAGGGE
jgi:thiol-disulfide isomerase/thioredoxin